MNGLDIDKPVAETRVVVAMSGGVDSSVTAAMLADMGYEVIGVTLQLYDHGAAVNRKRSCCAGQDIYDARAVAARLDIPHYVLDYESRFREAVIDDFADSYLRGETPVPCIRCNQTVKFRDLLATAKELGADALATGHYARRKTMSDGPALLRGIDPGRDQSYFLFATSRDQLDFLRFPLGGMEKAETRAHAERFDLPVAAKPDSQDICFVPEGNYARIVEKLRPEAHEPGDIIHLNGSVLGRHQGIINFTIGQRRRLGLSGRAEGEEVLYVVQLNPTSRQVVVGPRDALGTKRILIGSLNWMGASSIPDEGIGCDVKLRSTMEPVGARLFAGDDDNAIVVLDELQFGVSPGQACVVYDGERVLGGGWIQR